MNLTLVSELRLACGAEPLARACGRSRSAVCAGLRIILAKGLT